jgi:site-specific DNA-methyltransferase (adenine-specific)
VGISNNAGRGLDMELNQIYHMDCLEGMKDISDKSIDMILCDLPYGTTACKWDAIIPFEPLWSEYERVIKNNGAIVLTASQPFTAALVMSNPKLFRYEWIWEKNRGSNFATVKHQPMKEHESVLVFYKKKPIYNETKIPRSEGGKNRSRYEIKGSNTGRRDVYNGMSATDIGYIDVDLRCARSIVKFNTEVGLHPTQKPVALFEYLIRTYTNEGDTVLDNCIGSGTTAIACINTGRFFIGFEKELEYVEIANKRINEVFPDIGTTEPPSVAAAVGGC